MIIECTISTPQHKNNKVDSYFMQAGVFDTETLLFTTSDPGGHNVQFHSIDDFKRSRKEEIKL